MLFHRNLARRRSLATLLITVAALSVALVGAAPVRAAGTGGLVYKSRTKTVPNVEPGQTEDTVNCPTDHPHVTGGGVDITGPESSLDLEVGGTAPKSTHNGWVAAANNSSAGTAHMKTFAICSRGVFNYKSDDKLVGPNSQGQDKVLCPAATKLAGGGAFLSGGSHQNEIAVTKPIDGADADHVPDDGWLARGNNGLDTDQSLFVFAICARSGIYHYVKTASKAVPDNKQVTASINCPAGTHVTGGGTSITGIDLGAEVADSFPIDGTDAGTTPDNGWRGNVNNDSTGAKQHMQTFAICRG